MALGKPGRFDTEEFQQAVEVIKTAVKKAGKILIMYTMDEAKICQYFDAGFDAVTWGTDIKLFISLLRKEIGMLHES